MGGDSNAGRDRGATGTCSVIFLFLFLYSPLFFYFFFRYEQQQAGRGKMGPTWAATATQDRMGGRGAEGGGRK